MKNILIGVVIALIVAGGYYYYTKNMLPIAAPAAAPVTETSVASTTQTQQPITSQMILGTSTQGRAIIAYSYGTGAKKLLLVGGMHGGYEWNTALVAYEMMDYLEKNPTVVPAGVQVTVIPSMNPDGLFKTLGTADRFTAADVPVDQAKQVAGRFNANNVDLNRNFDCDWQAKAKWQNTTVSGGKAAFSEAETQAMKRYIEQNRPTAAAVWYSSAGGVYSSNCHGDVMPETAAMTDLFANASGYPAHKVFDYYEITGDMVNWYAKQGIPAISILLTDHKNTEFDKNKAGVEALLAYLAK